jgi:hypothetical protein
MTPGLVAAFLVICLLTDIVVIYTWLEFGFVLLFLVLSCTGITPCLSYSAGRSITGPDLCHQL